MACDFGWFGLRLHLIEVLKDLLVEALHGGLLDWVRNLVGADQIVQSFVKGLAKSC